LHLLARCPPARRPAHTPPGPLARTVALPPGGTQLSSTAAGAPAGQPAQAAARPARARSDRLSVCILSARASWATHALPGAAEAEAALHRTQRGPAASPGGGAALAAEAETPVRRWPLRRGAITAARVGRRGKGRPDAQATTAAPRLGTCTEGNCPVAKSSMLPSNLAKRHIRQTPLNRKHKLSSRLRRERLKSHPLRAQCPHHRIASGSCRTLHRPKLTQG